MTSKILSTNLIKSELRRKIWMYIVTLLAMLAVKPAYLLMRIDNMFIWESGLTQSQMIDNLIYVVRFIRSASVMIIAAVVFAFVSFSYTYSRAKVDMYHSLPIDRKKLYGIFAGTAIIPYIVIEISTMLCSIFVLSLKGLLNGLIIRTILSTFVYDIIFFILLFSISVIAIALTGNIWVGIIGTWFFVFGASSVFEVIDYYKSCCFQTYYGMGENTSLLKLIISPWHGIMRVKLRVADNMAVVFVLCAEAIILLTLAGFLYCKKPSECTYKAMCYKILEPIIRIPSVMCIALCGGIYIVYAQNSLTAGWYWVIFVIIGIISHGLINAIFHNDFKKMFSDWIQLIITLVAAAIIGSIFLFDLCGYDRYLPSEKDIEYAGISFDNIHDDINNYEKEEVSDGIRFNYKDADKYRVDALKTKDFESILELAKLGIYNIDKENSVFKRNSGRRTILYTVDAVEPAAEQNRFIIKYHLKNGRDIYRIYSVPMEDSYAATEKIYNTKEYKDSVIQLEEYFKYNEIKGISADDVFESEIFNLEGNDALIFMEALKQDYYAMTLKQLADSVPIAKLMSWQADGMQDGGLEGYYIYPEFTNTVAFLKAKGIEIDTNIPRLESKKVQSIDIRRYITGPNGIQSSVTYRAGQDDDLIEKLCDVLILDNLSYSNSVLKKYEQGIDINCMYLTDKGYVIGYYGKVRAGELPDKVYTDLAESIEQ